jgi:hypothetical protein
VWANAQAQGETADARAADIRALHGQVDDAPRREPMAVPSLLDLRLRRDLSNKWNEFVIGAYDNVRRWL